MKKVIFTVLLCLATIGSIQAKRTHIPMRVRTVLYEQKKKGAIRHAPAIRTNIPVVELNDNYISISSIPAGSYISVILYDALGNIIWENASNSSFSYITFDIPAEIIEEASSVVVTLNGIAYMGEIY